MRLVLLCALIKIYSIFTYVKECEEAISYNLYFSCSFDLQKIFVFHKH